MRALRDAPNGFGSTFEREVALGLGIGDDRVRAVIRWAADREARSVRLHITEGNEPAARLYERNGFELSGSTSVRERDAGQELEMVLDLGVAGT
ncbi:MAG: GNAT family N-acetyltransferase [Streptosporangiaceae bacterium]